MSRPLRIEFSGALYHVTARGNERRAIYRGDKDNTRFLDILSYCCARFQWVCHAYCLMDNHYHLLLETQLPNLSKGMRHLNGEYARWFNAAHQRVGHLFQGRFKSILVEKETYLLELARYIVLNPIRAALVPNPEEWPWSSYRSTAGMTSPHTCLTTDWLLAHFSRHRLEACLRYRAFVLAGRRDSSPMAKLKNQVYLGSEQFVEDALTKLDPEKPLYGVPRIQSLGARMPLEYYREKYSDHDTAMVMAYLSGHYTLDEIGSYFGKGRSTVSRKVKAYECCGKWEA